MKQSGRKIIHVSANELFDKLGTFLKKAAKDKKKPLIVLCGPTNSGKTAVSIPLALKYNGAIVSADSRQVYRHMDIGTDKIREEERKGVPHYMLDIVNPDEDFSLADYRDRALKAIEEIHAQEKLPIVVGGTGLYIDAICDNYEIPRVKANKKLRAELSKIAAEKGAEHLHGLLKEMDPKAAEGIHPNNIRYVIRAIEINKESGSNKTDRKAEPRFNVFKIGIDWPRKELYERINARAAKQIAWGLVDEVQGLLDRGYEPELPAMASLGYQEMVPFLKGQCPLSEALMNIQKNTRHYAKRQYTWLTRDPNINWLPGEEREEFVELLK